MQGNSINDKLRELKNAAWKVPGKVGDAIPEGVRNNLPWNHPESQRFARKYADKTAGLIKEGGEIVGEEAAETEQMARSFFKMLEAKLDLSGRTEAPSPEEVKEAIEQLKDVGRFGIFTALVILPGGVISLIGLEMLAARYGFKTLDLIPSSFRKRMNRKKKDPSADSQNHGDSSDPIPLPPGD